MTARLFVVITLITSCGPPPPPHATRPSTSELLYIDDTLNLIRCYKWAYVDAIACVPLRLSAPAPERVP